MVVDIFPLHNISVDVIAHQTDGLTHRFPAYLQLPTNNSR